MTSQINTQLNSYDIEFDRNHCQKLLRECKDADYRDAKNYVCKFFFRYKDKLFHYNNDQFDLYEQEKGIKLIPKDLCITKKVANPETQTFEKTTFHIKDFLQSTEFMSKEFLPTINYSKTEMIFTEIITRHSIQMTKNYLNMIKPSGLDLTLPKIVLTDTIKQGLKLINDHMLVVLCSNNILAHEFMLNFFACTFAGRKLRKCMYWQSAERTGKGIILNDLIKKILGERMTKTNSIESITQYTKLLEGCLLVNADELPVDANNYKSINDALKGLITEPTFTCRTMYQAGYTQTNTFNAIITTNNNAVTMGLNNNKRYVVFDIDKNKIGDNEYFNKLGQAVNNPDVRKAFYDSMINRYESLSNWNECDEFITHAKEIKIIEALPYFHKYIKENFVLKGKGINMKTNKFFEEYETTKDKTSKQQIGKYLTTMNILPKKIAKTKLHDQHYIYYITADDLLNVFEKNHWLDNNVDLINGCEIEEQDEYDQEIAIEFGIDKSEKSVKQLCTTEKTAKPKSQNEIIDNLPKDCKEIIKRLFNHEDDKVSFFDNVNIEEEKPKKHKNKINKIKNVKHVDLESLIE